MSVNSDSIFTSCLLRSKISDPGSEISNSFVAQRDQGIDLRRGARRDVTSEEGKGAQQRGYERERARISSAPFKQHARQKSCHNESRAQSDNNADQRAAHPP